MLVGVYGGYFDAAAGLKIFGTAAGCVRRGVAQSNAVKNVVLAGVAGLALTVRLGLDFYG